MREGGKCGIAVKWRYVQRYTFRPIDFRLTLLLISNFIRYLIAYIHQSHAQTAKKVVCSGSWKISTALKGKPGNRSILSGATRARLPLFPPILPVLTFKSSVSPQNQFRDLTSEESTCDIVHNGIYIYLLENAGKHLFKAIVFGEFEVSCQKVAMELHSEHVERYISNSTNLQLDPSLQKRKK